ncbi:hypothetical protein CAPTEDRAFT_208578, partial [Capitella teleta]
MGACSKRIIEMNRDTLVKYSSVSLAVMTVTVRHRSPRETGALWDKGTIGTPPVTKNVNLGITMKCDFRNLGDSPSFLCEQQREILSVSKTTVMPRNKKRKTLSHGQTEPTAMKAAVAMVLEGADSIRNVAKDTGIAKSTLQRYVNKAKHAQST